jgi:transcriptional regulator with XRE-family HTH domain
MPRREQPLPRDGGPIVLFARAMRTLRDRSQLPYRQLGAKANYSHVALQRAANGRQRPAWPLTEAFAKACGASPEEMDRIRRLWTRAADSESVYITESNLDRDRKGRPTYVGLSDDDPATDLIAVDDDDPMMFSTSERHLGSIGVAVERAAIRRGSLRGITTRRGFGDALRRFTECEGLATERQLAGSIGVGFVEVRALFEGQPTANPDLVTLILKKLGFDETTDREAVEFTSALRRLEYTEVTWYMGLRGQERLLAWTIKPGRTVHVIAGHLKTDERTVRNGISRLHTVCGTTNLDQLAEHLRFVWARSGRPAHGDVRPGRQPKRPTPR